MESLLVIQQAVHKFDVERSNACKVEVREQYQIEIPNRFEALQNLIDSKDINWPWKKIRISNVVMNFQVPKNVGNFLTC